MIDIKYLKNNLSLIAEQLSKRNYVLNVDRITRLLYDIETYTQALGRECIERKKLEKEYTWDKSGEIHSKLTVIKDLISGYGQRKQEYENDLNSILFSIPNIPDFDVVSGGKENNSVISEVYNNSLPFLKCSSLKSHTELSESLHLIDYKRGIKLGGEGYWIYTGDGALLEWALLQYFIEYHQSKGYIFILPPHVLLNKCGFNAGQFPKFKEDVYKINDSSFLLPTAETALVSLHADEILNEHDLPLKYFSFTPCYRTESGGYGSKEKGMIRGYQFNKVEMFQITTHKQSDSVFNELIEHGSELLDSLELKYRVAKLAAEDMSHSMARTYDLEVYFPFSDEYKEVSSISNARDYQARRANIRYKNDKNEKKFVHTLNGSGLATSRLFPAILEQYQQEDGSVVIPKVLQKYMNKEIIK